MLPVHERFYTFQGEGLHAGRAAFFIRLFGCPVHCPWCDSAGTWHPDYVPARVERLAPEALAAEAARTRAEFVVLTGGEPAIHDLGPLCEALLEVGLPAHIETSGAFPLRGRFDWVTLSPKRWKWPRPDALERADEFKLIVDAPEAIEEYLDRLALTRFGKTIWLHPEWSLRDDAATLARITEWIKSHGAPFRAGWQMHKGYAADLADDRSRPAAPLGGDPARGY